MLECSTNDVYEIDYSDTESSQTSGNVEKLNKSFDDEHEQHNNNHHHHHGDEKVSSFSANPKRYVKEHYMESNSDNELDELDYRYRKENEKSLKMNQIIDDYKTEVATINHRMTNKTITTAAVISTTQLNNLRGKQHITDNNGNKLNQSMNPVIKKYLKAKDQEIPPSHENYNNSISISQSNNRKINDLSKKSKNLKDLTKPASAKHSNNSNNSAIGKSSTSATIGQHHRMNSGDKMKKPPKSPSTGLYGQHQQRQDSTLDEFQIEKVVSWMSVNEDNFSELDFSVMGGGSGVCHINDNNKESEKGKDESTYQEIVSFIKEIEHDGKDTEDFKALKTDVEFKLNTILNSMTSPENEMSIECTDNGENANNKLK